MKPDAGQVTLDGEDITGRAPWRLVKRGMGRSFQQTNLFWTLSALDNVTLAEAAVTDATRKMCRATTRTIDPQRGRDLLERVGLENFAGVAASELSHGDQRSLEIATALAVESRFLLLDEPTAGLAPTETRTAVALIRKIAREESLTVLFVEHDMEVVFGIADWITVLHRGAVLAEGRRPRSGPTRRPRGLPRRGRGGGGRGAGGATRRADVLEVVGLNAFYGKSQVVFDLDLRVGAGEIGRRARPQRRREDEHADGDRRGRVEPRRRRSASTGQGCLAPPVHTSGCAPGIALVPSGSRAFPNLTVKENLEIVRGGRNGGKGWTVEDAYRMLPEARGAEGLERGQPLGRRAADARGRAGDARRPKLLMLDEPSEGLAR